MKSYDLIVIGGGPGGYVAAIRASQLGMRVALIEKDQLGGICLNWGCIPTKALLKCSEINHTLKHAAEFGFQVGSVKFDFEKIIQRSRDVAKQLSTGISHLMKKNNVTVIKGEGKLLPGKKVLVNGTEELSAKNIIIATGSRPRQIPALETDGTLMMNYKDALLPKSFPKNLLIVGSGAIGIEFASFYANMGAKVTVIEIVDRILPVEDQEISQFVSKELAGQGIEIHVNSKVVSAKKDKDKVHVELEINQQKKAAQNFDAMIIAVGIEGNIENLGLENTKIKVDRGHILTDKWCETDERGIYAIGDVASPPWLAHKASHEGVICVEKIAGKAVKPLQKLAIPSCIYCIPQVASVGLTEKQAREMGLNIKVGKFPFSGNGKAIAIGQPAGFIKTIFDATTGELLGAHMVGSEVTEMIQGYAIAMTLEATEEEIMHTIFPHPTLSEMMQESTLKAFDRAIHI